MNKGYEVRLDLVLGIHNPTMRFDEYDKNIHDFYITISKNDKVIENLDKALIVLVAIKPDKSVEAQFLEVRDGVAYGDLKPSMRDQVGVYEAKAMVTIGEQVSITGPIRYVVTEDYIIKAMEEEIEESEQYDIITEILLKLSRMEQEAQEGLDLINSSIEELEKILGAFDGTDLHQHNNKDVLDSITQEMLDSLINAPNNLNIEIEKINTSILSIDEYIGLKEGNENNLTNQINKLNEDLSKNYDELRARINLSTNKTNASIEQVKQDVNDAMDAQMQDFNEKIEEIKQDNLDTNANIEQVKQELEEKINNIEQESINEEIKSKIEDMENTLEEQIQDVNTNITNINNVVNSMDDKKADKFFKSNSSIVNPLGGLEQGDVVNNSTLQDLLTQLLFPYVKPIVNARLVYSPMQDFYEIGDIVQVSQIFVNIERKSEPIKEIKFYQNSKVIHTMDSNIEQGGTFVYNLPTPIELNKSINELYFQVGVIDNQLNEVKVNTQEILFNHPVYCGVIGPGIEITERLIKLLEYDLIGKDAREYALNLNHQRVIIAYPQYYGELASIKDTNGFEISRAFNKIELNIECKDMTVPYFIYVNDASTHENFKIKFIF